jgi:hypothetical protein
MADAVIVDDGGSTRIKRLMSNGIGEMDSLLDVDDLTTPPNSRGSTHDLNKVYDNAVIGCQDDTGAVTNVPIDSSFGTIEISSQLDQSVLIKKTNTKLTITVFSKVADPIVEAKQHKKKRRYVVANSGPIQTVKVDGTKIYDVNNSPTGRSVIYTSLVVT